MEWLQDLLYAAMTGVIKMLNLSACLFIRFRCLWTDYLITDFNYTCTVLMEEILLAAAKNMFIPVSLV